MIPVRVLAVRYLASASPALCRALGAPEGYSSLGMLTTDCDDATYIALDAATKAADVEVSYGRSFYAGAANASTPNAGEVIGILAGQTPGAVRSGMEAALAALQRVGFEETQGVPVHSMNIYAGEHLQDPAFYQRIKVEDRVFQAPKHYFFPVEQDEIDKHSKRELVQNLGWTTLDE